MKFEKKLYNFVEHKIQLRLMVSVWSLFSNIKELPAASDE